MDLSEALGEGPGGNTQSGGGCWPGTNDQSGGGRWPGGNTQSGGGRWPGTNDQSGGGRWPGTDNQSGGGRWPGTNDQSGGGRWPGTNNHSGGGRWPGTDNQSGQGSWPGTNDQSGQGSWPGQPGQPGPQGPHPTWPPASQPSQPGAWFTPSGPPGLSGPSGPGVPAAPQHFGTNMPFSETLRDGWSNNMMVTISGTVKCNANKFAVDLGAGGDIAFHFNPRFSDCGKKVVVCNSLVANQWGKEQRDHDFPFSQGRSFEMKILCKDNEFRVAVDGNHKLAFKHRCRDLKSIKKLCIHGDVTLSEVKLEHLP